MTSFFIGYAIGAVVGLSLLFLFGEKVIEWMMRRWPL